MQQFCITKMMMLIFSINAMRSYLYALCLVCRVSKNTLEWLLPNIADAIRRTKLRNLNHVQCSNLAPMEKEWFLAPMEYSPNKKSIMARMEHTPMVYSLIEKGMVLWKILFRSGNGYGKRQKKKCSKNDKISVKIGLMHYIKWIKSNVTINFRGIWTSLYFLIFFLLTIIINL